MKNRNSRFIIILLLNVYSIQVFASPFLDCQEMKGHEYSSQVEHFDAGHHMGNMVEDQGHHNNTSHNMAGIASLECDCSCDVCFGVVSIPTMDTAGSDTPDNDIHLIEYPNFLPSHISESLFRPPISA